MDCRTQAGRSPVGPLAAMPNGFGAGNLMETPEWREERCWQAASQNAGGTRASAWAATEPQT